MEQAIKINRTIAAVFMPFRKPGRYKVAEGGRGGGKSHFFGEEAIEQVFVYGKKALCCREVQKSIKESVKTLLENKIHKMGLAEYFECLDQEIRCKVNGGKISFTGLRQAGSNSSAADNIKSYEGYDICWVEEAQTISKYSLDILLPTIRKEGSEVWFSYNRKNDNEPVHSRFVLSDFVPEGTVHVYVNYWDNPWFPKELRQLMEADRANSIDDYNHIWCGLPLRRSKAHIITNYRVVEFEPPVDVALRHGADFGFYPDPCTIVRTWLDWDRKRLYVDYAEGAIKLDPDVIGPALYEKIPDIKRHKVIADCARPEVISQLKKQSYNVESCVKTPKSVEKGIEWLQAWEIWVHPRCEGLIEEFREYKRKVDEKTGDVLPVIIDKWNHYIDALRYAYSDLINKESSVDYVKMMGKRIGESELDKHIRIADEQLISANKRKSESQQQYAQSILRKSAPGLKEKDGTLYVKAKDLGLKLPGESLGGILL